MAPRTFDRVGVDCQPEGLDAEYFRRIRRDILAAADAVPAGFVTTFDAIAAQLDVMPRHVRRIIETLDGTDRAAVAWHRVVEVSARLPSQSRAMFDLQRARLAAEGVTCDDGGNIHQPLDHLAQIIVLTQRRLGTADD